MGRGKALIHQLASRELPTLPPVVQIVLSSIDDPHTSADDVGQLIAEDPAMTAQVLRVANSVIHNPTTRKIDSAALAIARIGFDEIRRMVLAIGVVQVFKGPKLPIDYPIYWRHCIATGLLAEAVADTSVVTKAGNESRGVYFAGGLLHDIGVLLLAQEFEARYARVMKNYIRAETALGPLEKARFGASHGEVGGEVASHWGIPDAIVQAAFHHDIPDAAISQHQTYVRVIHAADWLAGHLGFGLTHHAPEQPFQDEVWCKLALDSDSIPLLCAAFDRLVEQSRLFGLLEP